MEPREFPGRPLSQHLAPKWSKKRCLVGPILIKKRELRTRALFFPRAGGVDDGYDMDDDHDDDDEDRQPRRQPRTNKQKETKNGALKKDIGEELREKQEKNKKQTRCDSKQKWTSVRSSPAP